ncbi:MAG TPA: hypothetical protein DCS29_03815 [Candidatus Magasanikbacteria bacterium]|nr:hypothetical protein [Candidatus Magasanikbacteria bacterium]
MENSETIGLFMSWYNFLRAFFEPAVPYVFPRHLPQWLSGGQKILFMTANRVTYARTVALVPVGVLMAYEYFMAAFVTFVIAAVMDFVDGLVATVHKKLGHYDDEDFGKFIDAFCDKWFFAGVAAGTLLMLIHHAPMWYTLITSVTLGTLCVLEAILGTIRALDYLNNKRGNGSAKKVDLRAPGSGKLKMALEMIGLGGLILSLPSPHAHWAGYVGIVSLATAIPFAYQSLSHKLAERKRSP